MTLSGVQAPDQRGEVNRDEAVPGSQLLSVAEVQQALRSLRARRPFESPRLLEATALFADAGRRGWPADASPTARADGLAERWVGVVAAHPGAGASTVALAIADAAAAVGRTAYLVETAHPTRSGLVGVADAELGVDPDGVWRLGSRGRVTIHRRATSDIPTRWPARAVSEDDLVVIDLGSPMPGSMTWLSTGGCRTVVVCRPTVPGVRLAEQLLNALINGQVIVASVGADRWPGEVSAGLGPRLRALRAGNAVVTVPTVRRLEVTGLTSFPLPKPVAAAGRSLLELIHATHSNDATASAQPAPGRKGGQR